MKYNPALDGLRAVSALAVVAAHSLVPWAKGGAVGVDVFFVLSGYLITNLLWNEREQTGSINLWCFFRNRAMRLYPPLLFMLAIWAIVLPLMVPGIEIGWRIAIVALYLTDYWIAFDTLGGGLGHTWSLAVEEHFYLVWPVFVALLYNIRKAHKFKSLQVLSVLAVLAFAWRCTDFLIWEDVRRTIYRFDTNLSGLLLGACLALLPVRLTSQSASSVSIVATLVLVLMFFFYRQGTLTGITLGIAIANIAAGALILSLAHKDILIYRILAWRPLVRLGVLSYAIYLWHYPIAVILRHSFPPLITLLIVSTLSIILAHISYTFIEHPLKKWRLRMPRGGKSILQN